MSPPPAQTTPLGPRNDFLGLWLQSGTLVDETWPKKCFFNEVEKRDLFERNSKALTPPLEIDV